MSFTWHHRIASRGWSTCSPALLLLASTLTASAARPPVPAVRLPLAALGFPGYPVALMHAGASMATIHVLDSTHLLFTYGLRSLVPRIPGDDANDRDRLVGAEIVEVPSGQVLARTEWHLHDYGRYLWSAGHGVFLMRSGDELSVFAPLRGLASGTAFQRTALPHRPGHPMVVSASPDGQIVTVELQKKSEEGEDAGDGQPQRKHTVVEFYRLAVPAKEDGSVALQAAGVIGSPDLLRLALDGDGYLWADDLERDRWSVSFNEYAGKPQQLAAVNSTCAPRLELLGRSEFATLTCGTSEDTEMLTAYGFDGHENWEEHVGAMSQPPAFVTAPTAGRFAMSRLIASGGGSGINGLGEEASLIQEVRVYGTESGDLLLNIACLPVARTPENFDLSADGRTLAVLGTDSINLYTLPQLTTRDRKDLADAETMMPPLASGPVVLRHITRPVAAEEQAVSSEETTAPQRPVAAPAASAEAAGANPAAGTSPTAAGTSPTAAGTSPTAAGTSPTAAGTSPTPAETTTASGDSNAGPRKPPTLLAPGEQPEYKDRNKPE